MKLEVNELYYQYPQGLSLEDISIHVPHHSFVGVVGPNGSGKSTFFGYV